MDIKAFRANLDDMEAGKAVAQAVADRTGSIEADAFDFSGILAVGMAGENGIRRLNVTADVDGVGRANIYLDASLDLAKLK